MKSQTQFVIKFNGGYYRGTDFVKDINLALTFDTREEAEKRCKLRSDWTVERIENQKGYAYEKLFIAALMMLLLVFSGATNAQTFTQSFHTITSSNTTQIASGDLRGKGYADLVIAQGTQVFTLANNGDGTFQAPVLVGNYPGLFGIAVGNIINGDSKAYIIVLGETSLTGPATLWINGVRMDAPTGSLSGPFIQGHQVLTAGGNCSNGSINGGEQPANTTEVYFGGQSAFLNDCGAALSGVTNTFALFSGSGYLFNSTSPLSNQNVFSPYSFCGSKTIGFGDYALSFNPSGSFCLQQPGSMSVIGFGNFTLTGDQNIQAIVPVVFNNGVGLAAIMSSASLTPIEFVYGSNFLNLTQAGSLAANLSQAKFIIADIFKPTGLPAQDIAVLDANGLTVYTQGIFSGAFSPANYNFPAQAIGTSATKTLQYTNTGTTLLSPLVISISGSSDYTQSNDCPSSFPSGAACNIQIQFLPSAIEASSTATLTATSTLVTTSAALTGSSTADVSPSITTQPVSQTVTAGQSVTFTTAATGTAPLTFTWKKNNTIVGTNSPTLTFTTIALDNQAQISVTVSSPFGSAPSSTATLTVLTVPVITTQPQPITVILGQTATFNVVVTGSTPLSYSWTKAGASVGTNSATYTTGATTAADNGAAVNATVTNAAGHATSSNAILSLNFPVVLTSQPQPQTVLAGATASFAVTASGTNDSYFWKLNNSTVGSNSPSLSLTTTATMNNGQVYCIISNAYGPSVQSSTVNLTVNIPPSISSTNSPGPVAVGVNKTATFSVTASGTPTLSYQWSRAGVVIPGATSASYTTPNLTAPDDHAVFTATVSSPYGQATASFTVNVILPPVVTAQSPNMTVNVGTSASFAVNYTTNDGAPATFVWTHNGQPVSSTIQSFMIPSVATTDAGTVQLVISDIGGSTTVSWTLSISAPTVTLNLSPATQTVQAGNSARYVLQVNSNAGNVSLTCSTTVPSGVCSLDSTILSAGQVNVTVTTPTTATIPSVPFWPIAGFILALSVAFVTRPEYRRRLVPVMATCIILLALGGCAGGASSAPATKPPTPTPTPTPTSTSYTVTVTGRAGTATNPVIQTASAVLVVTK